jgi:hypothetical protein
MMRRGLLFTVGVAAVGSVLLVACLAYGLTARKHLGDSAVFGIMRASSHCATIGDVARGIFRESAGADFRQVNGSFSLFEALPRDVPEYASRARALRAAASLLDSTALIGDSPAIASGIGVNYSHPFAESSIFYLPQGCYGVAFAGDFKASVHNCSLSFDPGEVPFAAEASGNGSCRKAARVDLDLPLRFEVNGDAVITGGHRRLALSAIEGSSMNYSLSVSTNLTPSGPPVIPGGIRCVGPGALKESWLELT